MRIRTLQTLLGLVLIAAGVAGWFVLEHRSEWVVLALVGFGGFLVSKTATIEAVAAAQEMVVRILGRT